MVGNFWYPELGGGMEHYFHGLVEHLAQADDDLSFFTLGNPPEQFLSASGYSLGQTTTPLWLRIIHNFRLFRKREHSSYQILNAHFALTTLPALLAFPKTLPIIFHFAGPWALESQVEGGSRFQVFVKKMLEDIVFKRCTHFITASTSFSQILQEHYGIKKERISTMPLAIDTEHFTPTDKKKARQALSWSEDPFIIFTARRLIQRVGIHELLQAIAGINSTRKYHVMIAGRGPKKDDFQALINSLGIADRVTLVGYMSEDDLPLAYAAADVVVLPTQQLEGFGLTFAEALACGTPVVVSPVGGMPEYVAPLSPQLVMKDSTPHGIQLALEAILQNPEQLPDRLTCREYALQHFSWAVNIKQVRALFVRFARPSR